MSLLSKLSAIFTFLLLNSCSQGTEVGNGVRRPNKDTQTQAGGAASNTESNKTSSGPDQGGATHSPNFYSYLLVPCASPLGESKAGLFKDTHDHTIDVKRMVDRTLVTVTDQLIYTITPKANAPAYDVAITPAANDLTCVAIQNTPMNGGNLFRSVTYTDGNTLQWQLEAQDVRTVTLINATGSVLETWSK